MVIGMIFAFECLIFAGLSAWLARNTLRTLRQMRRSMERIQPVLRQAQQVAAEAAPVMHRAQALAMEAREVMQMAQQTQEQARTALETVRQAGSIKPAFQEIRSLTSAVLRKKRKPASRLAAVTTALASLVRRRPKRDWRRLVIPAGIGALLSSAGVLALKRSRK